MRLNSPRVSQLASVRMYTRVHKLGKKRIVFLNIQQVSFEMGENSLSVIVPPI